jgi:hypothetical protein
MMISIHLGLKTFRNFQLSYHMFFSNMYLFDLQMQLILWITESFTRKIQQRPGRFTHHYKINIQSSVQNIWCKFHINSRLYDLDQITAENGWNPNSKKTDHMLLLLWLSIVNSTETKYTLLQKKINYFPESNL